LDILNKHRAAIVASENPAATFAELAKQHSGQ
jgi:hypothetical protein